MQDTLESKVAKTILEQPTEIEIGGKKYSVPQPTLATLILVSESISRLPMIDVDKDDFVNSTLACAKDCRILGEIFAILILGAKHLTTKRKKVMTVRKKRMFGLLPDKLETIEVTETVDCKEDLAKEILDNLQPRDANATLIQLLSQAQLDDFFSLTTFLLGVNQLKKKVDQTNQTASGQ